MPLQKLQFRPGTNRESTTYANEGGWYETEKVRFRSGFPEKIGGWVRLSTYTFVGVARTLWNWVTLNSSNLLAVGTNQKVYVENGGQYYDITPYSNPSGTTLANNPIATTSGSKLVVITGTSSGLTIGTWVTLSGATAVGGLTMNGEFEVVSVGATTYTVVSSTAASSTATGGGAAVVAKYDVPAGWSVYTIGNGWGAGAWSRGAWGSGTTIGIGQQLRLWSLDNYGQDLVLAPRLGAPYYWAVDTSTYARAVTLASLSTTAGYDGARVPTTVLQMMTSDIQRFSIALGANPYDPATASTTFDPLLVRWSDQENIYQWVPAVTNQSGEQRLSNGSVIVAGRHSRQEILIWTDSALFSMQYLGPPYVFGFTLLQDNISAMSPNCMVTASNITYWMGVDKFYMYSGRVETLPCALRQYVFSDLNRDQAYQIVSGSNEGYNEVWWMYPSSNSMVNDRYVIYNYLERIWYYGNIHRTAWLDSATRPYPMAAYSVQATYLNETLTSSDTALTLLDTTSFPTSGTILIESEQITYTGNEGNTLTGCVRGANNTTATTHTQYTAVSFVASNTVLYHEASVDDESTGTAQAIEAYIQSSDFDIGDGHNFGFVWRMLPDVTFSGSTATSPTVYFTVRPRTNSGTNYITETPSSVVRTATYPVEQYTGQVYTRIRGRQMALKISSSALGVTWQLGTPRIDVRQDGRR
jgi:hypothetical protein